MLKNLTVRTETEGTASSVTQVVDMEAKTAPRERSMPQGDKDKYTDKQKRQAEHIEEGYEKRGVSDSEAERRAWATVNKTTGGGKKSGSGRGKQEDHSPERKGGRIGSANRSEASRSAAAKKGWKTRRHKSAT